MSNRELVKLYQNGDSKALEELINNNVALIKKIAMTYNGINRELELDDLIQVGNIGLINAAKKYSFDMKSNTKFSTFAFLLIKQEILAAVNGKSDKDIENNKLNITCSSLNAPIKNEENLQLIDMIDSKDKCIENVEDKIYMNQLRKELNKAMHDNNTLTEREILKLHYGWETEPVTLSDIEDLLNIKHKKANVIEQKALKKLRNSLWGRTTGKIYRDEIIPPHDISFISVEKEFDKELMELFAM